MDEPRTNIWSLLGGALFGLGVGVIASVMIPAIPPKWSLGFGMVVITVAVFHENLFRNLRWRWVREGGGSLILATLIWASVFWLWHVVPKSDPPATKRDVSNLLDQLPKPTSQSFPPPVAELLSDKPITKSEIATMFKPYFANRDLKQSLDLSNDDLRVQAKDVSQRIVQVLTPTINELYHAEILPNQAERAVRLEQVKKDFLGNPETKLLFAKANYLHDVMLVRLGRASSVPTRQLFDGSWPGSTGNVVALELVQLADQLPQGR